MQLKYFFLMILVLYSFQTFASGTVYCWTLNTEISTNISSFDGSSRTSPLTIIIYENGKKTNSYQLSKIELFDFKPGERLRIKTGSNSGVKLTIETTHMAVVVSPDEQRQEFGVYIGTVIIEANKFQENLSGIACYDGI